MIRTLLTLAMPLIMGGVGLYALGRGVDVFSALTDGMRDGLKTLLRIFPSLLALLPAIAMVRASGLLDAVTGLLSPVLAVLGIPEQLAPLLLLRPLSGSGALAAATDLIGQYGADSLLGRTAAVMLGSTETTFYVLAVYFGAAGIQKGRRILPAALLADLVGFVMAAQTVRCFWG
ncbi:MAG: spore maturation protein [Oscillospiraceae bacterium]|nr:spore maturation protein [Oscillospiraceae bacterium]MDY4104214.1 nucleoside recognition domain-containing protein [Oscillospiraceae bacterium]